MDLKKQQLRTIKTGHILSILLFSFAILQMIFSFVLDSDIIYICGWITLMTGNIISFVNLRCR